MTLTQLRYIVALDTFRNFKGAADHCFVTQPTLSMQIHKLEKELDVLIFDRSKQPLFPTDLGAEIVKQARCILQETERLNEIVNHARGRKRGTLRLGIISTLAPYLLPLFIQSFYTKYPGISLHIKELLTKDIVDGIENGTLDAGIVALPVARRGFHSTPLFFEPLIAYVHQQHTLYSRNSISPKDLSPDEILLLEQGHCFREQTLKLCDHNGQLNTSRHEFSSFQSGNLETLRNLVDTQLGITLLPYLATLHIQNTEKEHSLRYFQEPKPARHIGIISCRAYLKKNLLDTLASEILESIPDELKDGSARYSVISVNAPQS